MSIHAAIANDLAEPAGYQLSLVLAHDTHPSALLAGSQLSV